METNKSRLRFQIGGGYTYSFLKDFNEKCVDKFMSDVDHKPGLHSGWTAHLSSIFRITPFVHVGVGIYRSAYHISGFKNGLSFEDYPGGVNYSYNLEKDIYLKNSGFEIFTTFYPDQLIETRTDSRLNFGIDIAGAYVWGNYKTVRTESYYKINQQEDIYRDNYWQIKTGLNVRYNINNPVLQAIVLKTGYRHVFNSEIPYYKYQPWGVFEKLKVDFSGFYVNLGLEIGWNTGKKQ